jgi:1-acyl-sn-glycerol-3-phosphate acyltransferase
MWLLPHLSAISGAAVRLYYRASRDGERMPRAGPLLIVSNHPNSLLDPAFVAWAARRPVRFLAKAPLLRDPLVGWLVRAAGSLPVYRQQDDPGQVGRNADSFRAVHAALANGAAIALFPEGTSHSRPGLAPLKTGAARIALGAVAEVGGPFPIVPVGLVFRAKDHFRSSAHAVVGAPVAWDDLASRGQDDREAVRELTARIDHAVRAVTLNLARWEDESVVRTAEAVWAAAREADPSPSAHVVRLGAAADVLANIRASGDERWVALAADVAEHARVLGALGIRPHDVVRDTTLPAAARWALRRLTLVGALQAALAAVVVVLFWIPYRITGFVAGRLAAEQDTISTYRVLGGALFFLIWILLLTGVVWAAAGWLAGVVSLVLLPALAVTGLYALERWRSTASTVRRWILARGDPEVAALRVRQHELAVRLDDALASHPVQE